MRGAGLLLLAAAVAALPGCRLFERNKDRDRDRDRPPSADPASRTRDRDDPPKNWLDPPAAARDKAEADPAARRGDRTDARDPRFDARDASRRIISGTLEDDAGKRVADGYVSIEPYPPTAGGAKVGVRTDEYGLFVFPGLKSGQTYVLTAEFKVGGRPLAGRQYVTVPNRSVRLVVKEDLSLAPVRPDAAADLPAAGGPRGPAASPGLPFPAENTDQSWSPIGPTPPATRPAAPARPDLVAPLGKDWNGSPPVSIPNPGLPPPTLDGSTSRAVKGGDGFVLVTAGGRERSFPTGRAGELVLLDFMTTTCGPCRKAVPTLARLQREYGRSGLEVVGVVCDPEPADRRRELAAAYQDEHRLPYGLCVEPGAAGALQDRYKVDRYPTLVLLDARGRTLWRGHPSAVRELEQAIRAAGE